MQRRRSVRRVMADPNVVHNPTYIEKRQDRGRRRRVLENSSPPAQHNTHIDYRPQIDHRATYSSVSPIFKGETIYIIGGGPSLKNFDFRQLEGSKTIAINKALFYHNSSQVVYWTDTRFYSWYKNDIDNYKGLKYTIKPGSQYTNDIKLLKKGKPYGLEKDPDYLAHGFNSGYAAINLAYHLGAAKIILLGFDMCNNGNETHFHDGYPTRGTSDKMYIDKFIPGFKELKSEILNENVQIYNASAHSMITVFPKITIEQALSFR